MRWKTSGTTSITGIDRAAAAKLYKSGREILKNLLTWGIGNIIMIAMPLPPDISKPFFVLNPDKADRVMCSLCIACDNSIRHRDFRNRTSLKEYSLSGFCQTCQDKIWGTPEESVDWDGIDERLN